MQPFAIDTVLRIAAMTGTNPDPQVQENIDINPACEVSLNTLADLFTRSYTNYFVPIEMDASSLSWLLSTQTIDLASSVVLDVDGVLAGFTFISVRGLSQRVAAMGVLPEFRGRGFGQKMLKQCIENAREVGVHKIVLEVIDQNAHALAIYRQLGFEVRRQLVGYQHAPATADRSFDDELHEIDPREVAKAAVHEGVGKLPWQISAESWYATRPPSRAYTLERSVYAIVSQVTETSARLNAILVPRTKRRKGWGRRMLSALYREYPNREWLIPAVIPEDVGSDFFLANGFQRHEIRQYEMVLRLDEASTRYPYEA